MDDITRALQKRQKNATKRKPSPQQMTKCIRRSLINENRRESEDTGS